jgi:hypothetical protein
MAVVVEHCGVAVNFHFLIRTYKPSAYEGSGSGGRGRTYDKLINSQLLYH